VHYYNDLASLYFAIPRQVLHYISPFHLASIVNVLRKKSVCAQSSICFMLYNVLIGFNLMIWNELEI
jgi:hypothetical protein